MVTVSNGQMKLWVLVSGILTGMTAGVTSVFLHSCLLCEELQALGLDDEVDELELVDCGAARGQ